MKTRFEPPAEPPAGGKPYVFGKSVRLAIDVALAAGRPLLITGNPGSGKTTLARNVAAGLGWRFLPRTITSRTRLEDLEAEMDMLQRLAHAQQHRLQPEWTYLKPGVLWWAFDRAGAATRGRLPDDEGEASALLDPSEGNTASDNVVVLLDEIDKADPDLPNDLLEPLDRRRFSPPLVERPRVEAAQTLEMLIVLTSNGERELPPAFVRRCVTLTLADPGAKTEPPGEEITLEEIAAAHFGDDPTMTAHFTPIARRVDELRAEARRNRLRPPSTAEYIDALQVLKEYPDFRREEIWRQVEALLLQKALPTQSFT